MEEEVFDEMVDHRFCPGIHGPGQVILLLMASKAEWG